MCSEGARRVAAVVEGHGAGVEKLAERVAVRAVLHEAALQGRRGRCDQACADGNGRRACSRACTTLDVIAPSRADRAAPWDARGPHDGSRSRSRSGPARPPAAAATPALGPAPVRDVPVAAAGPGLDVLRLHHRGRPESRSLDPAKLYRRSRTASSTPATATRCSRSSAPTRTESPSPRPDRPGDAAGDPGHRGPALLRARRRRPDRPGPRGGRRRSPAGRPGRLDDHPAVRQERLHGRRSARSGRKFVEAALAYQLEQEWSKRRILTAVPEHRVLRAPRVRRRGGGPHLLRHARALAAALAGGAARRAGPGAERLRPGRPPDRPARRRNLVLAAMLAARARSRRPTTRCYIREPRAPGRATRWRSRRRAAASRRTSRSTSSDQLVARSARSGPSAAACGCTPRSTCKLQAAAAKASQAQARSRRPVRRAGRDRPAHRRRSRPWSAARLPQEQFNLAAQARRQPGSAFKPFVLLAALAGGNPAADGVRLEAAVHPDSAAPLCRHQRRGRLPGLDPADHGHDVLRQRGLRPADGRVGPGRCGRGPPPGIVPARRRTWRSASAACASASRRSRWPTPTPRSPTRACASAARCSSARRSPGERPTLARPDRHHQDPRPQRPTGGRQPARARMRVVGRETRSRARHLKPVISARGRPG